MKKKIFALCAIMLLASGCGKVPKLENGKEAIVTFKDGEKISVDDFYELIKNEYGLNSLISMVDKYICETEFEDYKDTASKNADALINSLKEQYGSEDKLLEALQGSGYNTIDAYKDYAYLSYLQSHAIEEYAKTKITDKEIENYYKNDAIGDMEINHILITSNVKKDATDDEKKAAQDEAKKKANEVIDKLNTAKKNGEDITDWDITKRALAGISFAFQQPVRFKGIGVKDLLSLAAGEKLSTSGACTYLSEVGLCAADYVNREVDTSLSGGEIKRIEIATILARKQTKLAVFDEPEAGIDLWSFQKLISVFEKLHEQQQSIMIISHQERILNIADQIVLVANGSIKQIGTKEEIMPQLMEVAGVCDFYKK